MSFSKNIINVGVNDHQVDLFEGQFDVPFGMAYNSYVILDEKIAVMDSVEWPFAEEWLSNIDKVCNGKTPSYLVVQHMEPDHSSSITMFMDKYKDAIVVSSAQAFKMMAGFYKNDYKERQIVVTNGSTLGLGSHKLNFVTAPMVHWPEVIMTYEESEKVFFAADAFGKFGANDVNDERSWDIEAARYYFGIVGKFGTQVQALLKKAAGLEIKTICSLHGPVLTENLGYYLDLYNKWSSYTPEHEGVLISYTSVYGNTKKAALLLKKKLNECGCEDVIIHDLARDDMYQCVADAFRYKKQVLATTTYNGAVYPKMKEFIDHLLERQYQGRIIGLVENGSWAPTAAKGMKDQFASSKNIVFTDNNVKIMSSLSDDSIASMDALVKEIISK